MIIYSGLGVSFSVSYATIFKVFSLSLCSMFRVYLSPMSTAEFILNPYEWWSALSSGLGVPLGGEETLINTPIYSPRSRILELAFLTTLCQSLSLCLPACPLYASVSSVCLSVCLYFCMLSLMSLSPLTICLSVCCSAIVSSDLSVWLLRLSVFVHVYCHSRNCLDIHICNWHTVLVNILHEVLIQWLH